ncbi:MAG: FAD-dependent oxidoreductase [Bacillota bacterium]
MINLKIDGLAVAVEEGATLMEAARRVGIYIPGLCSHPDLPPAGICGLCAVEVDGREKLAQACETRAEEGMNVQTGTARVKEYRRDKLAAILANHPHSCLTCAQQDGCSRTQCSSNVPENERCCPKLGNCEVQKVARHVGIKPDTGRYRHPGLPVISDEPLIQRDYNFCIGCQRCVRMCREVRGVEALQEKEMEGRKVAAPVGATLSESHCRFCTACVQVCPTGALTDKDLPVALGEGALVPCRSSCPAGVDVPRYVRYIAAEKFDLALGVIREKVPFPATLGRVCFHPCENNCRRGSINEPVSICRLKRFVADQDTGWWRERQRAALPSGRQVAVVGSGPAGLAAAYFLARLGHGVTVFEALPVAGGMPRTGIPAYRLTKDILAEEIGEIERAGVRIKTNCRIDDAGSLLSRGCHAVLLATGCQAAARLRVTGEDLAGVLHGVSFLRRVSLGEYISPGRRVAVIGGGNVAIDTARTALRLGAEEVHLYCLESPSEMPAFPGEIEAALEEGVVMHHARGVQSILGENGKVTGFVSIAVASVFDSDGRFNPGYIPGTEEEVRADSIIVSIGQAPELDFLGRLEGITGRGGLITVDPRTMATPVSGIFACGDAVSGPKSVIEAIASGRLAARSIDQFLGGDGNIDEELVDPETAGAYLGKVENFAGLGRHGKMQRPWNPGKGCSPCPPDEALLAKFNEVEQGLLEEMAVTEAGRCLQCDLRLLIKEPPVPPDSWLEFNGDNVSGVPETEGVYQLLDENKKVLAIVGTANLRQALEDQLEYRDKVRYFGYEEEPMYTSRESQLIQQFLQEHGRLPEGVGDLDDLF